MEQQKHHTEPPENAKTGEVIAFPAPGVDHPKRRQEKPVTDEELREYRENRAELMEMLAFFRQFRPEWQAIKTQCPLAIRILQPDD